MRISVCWSDVDSGISSGRDYELVGQPAHCCKAMSELFGSVVFVGLCGLPPRPEHLRVCLVVNAFLPDGIVTSEDVGIGYCPWCGRKIEIVDIGDDGVTARLPDGAAPDPVRSHGCRGCQGGVVACKSALRASR